MSDTAPPLSADYRGDQRAFFDTLITRDWEAYRSTLWDTTRRLEISEIFRRISPRTVLDVGCGCGYHDVLIAQQASVQRVEAIDYSPESIRVAEEQYPHPRVHRRVADVFTDGQGGDFDLVASFQVIEHLPDQERFAAACARRARRGGWVAIATPNRLRLDNRLRSAFGRERTLVDPMHFRELSRRELESLGSSVGLRPVASFAHGLTLTVPRLNLGVVPARLGITLGRRLPALGNVICVVFERPG